METITQEENRKTRHDALMSKAMEEPAVQLFHGDVPRHRGSNRGERQPVNIKKMLKQAQEMQKKLQQEVEEMTVECLRRRRHGPGHHARQQGAAVPHHRPRGSRSRTTWRCCRT